MKIPTYSETYNDNCSSMHYAKIYCRGKLISEGYNTNSRNIASVNGRTIYNRTLHAEIHALSKIYKWREKGSVYNDNCAVYT